jgi:signal peptidase I, bacterial type
MKLLEKQIKKQSKLQEEITSLPERPLLENKSSPPLRREIGYFLIKLLLLGVIFSVLLLVIFGVTRNTDLGMSPAVKHGDLVFYFRMDKEYVASDLAVFTYEGDMQIRRVVAIEGDTVDITEHGLSINGRVQDEVEIIGETLVYTDGITLPVTLNVGEIFLLGDSREFSKDSRLYGVVNAEDTHGKVMVLMRRRKL